MKATATLALILLLTGCANRPPSPSGSAGNPLREAYHVCRTCGSLDGGVYGKHNVSSWRSPEGEGCWHDWQVIDKRRFGELWIAAEKLDAARSR